MEALVGVAVGLVVGAFLGDKFGQKVRGLVMDVFRRGKGGSDARDEP